MSLEHSPARQKRRTSPAKTSHHHHPPYRVIPFVDWCKLNGFSVATGRRIIDSGRVKVTALSPRRIGIREDHNAEFQDSCIRKGA